MDSQPPASMKVLHVLPFPGVGGTEIATRRIADAVRPLGVESTALLLQPTPELVRYFEAAGIRCVLPEAIPTPSVRHGLQFLRQSRSFGQYFRATDLIHCADVDAAYKIAVAGRMAKRPVLCQVRNRRLTASWRDRLFVGRPVTHFAFVSAGTRAQFPVLVTDDRSTILYDGIEIPPRTTPADGQRIASDLRRELGLPPDAQIAAMFARVNPQKDYPTLIKAAATLRDSHPRLRFLIVGDYTTISNNRNHHQKVAAEIAAAGLVDRFIFAGFRTDIANLMIASDLCVLSTHFEGLPLVIIEAMALGRPTVATNVDGVAEALDHDRTGLLHRHGDDADLAACIARVLDDPDHARRLGEAARAEASLRFGHERFGNDIYAVYRRLLAHS